VRDSERRRHAGHVIVALAGFSLALTAALHLTDWAYRRVGLHPRPELALIVNAVLGILLLTLGVNLAGMFFWSGRRNFRDILTPITDALNRIARGDFTTRVDTETARGPFQELARTVNQTAARLDEMEKMRQEFVSNVSHEIQSPLTSIRGFASALRKPDVGEAERVHYLDVIESESQRLAKLSANLLKLAALESDQPQPAPTSYRLDLQIRNAILACETQWTAKGLELDVYLEEAEITAHEEMLSQVWNNLIHNAIKFTPEGGTIRVRLARHGEGLEARFADSGIGISPEDRARVFERFYKADRSRQSALGGSGLGLAIAKRIVDMHQGRISVDSRPGAGAEFVVTLPAMSV
jgi:two-component system, OmpR family, phosphate regulon sensor histidine kinase PhoR